MHTQQHPISHHPSISPSALGGNLGGITSGLLGLDGGQLAAALKLDIIFPVKGFMRCVDYTNQFGACRRPMKHQELQSTASTSQRTWQ